MEWLTIMLFSLITGSIGGIAFIVHRIVQEEREKREKLAFVRAFSERYSRRKGCPNCGCLPCHCGS